MNQRTIKNAVSLEGIGLHSGRQVRITVSPAPPNSGITFRVRGHDVVIPAAPETVVDGHYATTIGRHGVRVQSIEHLMAAAAGLGLDNLEVEVDGIEIPAMDGSARPFVTLLASAGRVSQAAARRPIVVPHPIRVGDDRRWLEIKPSRIFEISYVLENDHPAIGHQALGCTLSERSFVDEFAPARTYGFLKDVGLMRKNGLARGGSLDNAIVLGKRGPLNGLRFRDEFVRHKILDLIGDLALLGRPVVGHISARNGGHALNVELAVAMQRALGLERRAVAAATAPARAPLPEALTPAPGLA